ncbi:MAG: substrate-binding domain-containing protein [Burkholderiales bacterium]|nr:substrate-binding domain-containing protein [Burkholderiales bacterium]
MKISGEVRWTIEGLTMEPRLVMLLESIARLGNLQAAAKTTGLSYRHAWGLLEAAGNELGESLVVPQQGRGTLLSPLAERLLAGLVDASGPLAAAIREAEARLLTSLEATQTAAPAKPVVVYASHDLALAQLRDLLQYNKDATLDLHFQGSLDCLAALRRKQCDIAGFHLPVMPGASALVAQLRPWLRMKSLHVAHLFDRTQGLMVAAGNPKKLSAIADLARKGVRFVNRQPGSGTRLCFDFLLAQRGLRPGAIHGYAHEEFTHAAVAATVASGMADAGFGIEAAAHEQGLSFVPVVREHYYFAARSTTLRQPRLQALLAHLDSPAFQKLVHKLAGYQPGGALEWRLATEILE